MKFVLFPCSEISPNWHLGPTSEPVFFASHTQSVVPYENGKCIFYFTCTK